MFDVVCHNRLTERMSTPEEPESWTLGAEVLNAAVKLSGRGEKWGAGEVDGKLEGNSVGEWEGENCGKAVNHIIPSLCSFGSHILHNGSLYCLVETLNNTICTWLVWKITEVFDTQLFI